MSDETRTKAAQAIQALFRTTPLLLFGSGFSCGYGLPSMGALGDHLINAVGPALKSGEAKALWTSVLPQVRANLEEGLNKIASGAAGREEVVQEIRLQTADLIIQTVREVERRLLSDKPSEDAAARLLRKLFDGAPQNAECIPIITTNYDTLIEFFCDVAKLPVDTGFSGYRLRGMRSQGLFETQYRRSLTANKGASSFSYRQHLTVRLMKPHGSITWQMTGGTPTETLCDLVDAPRAIVVPGPSKYEDATINSLFDSMRTEMNAAVNKASALMCVGFGFNDAHLEGMIRSRLESGMPILVIVKDFTPNIVILIEKYPHIIAIRQAGSGGEVHYDQSVVSFSEPIWLLDTFLSKFLE